MMTSDPGDRAFSLVEVVLALGIMAFCLIPLIGLLPAAMKSNQVSTEEIRAVNLLTVLEADLRNTHPAANQGKSLLFGLALPYATNAGGMALNTALVTNTVSAANSIGLQDDETPTNYAASPRPRYQASVIYTSVPAAGKAPTTARLIVNWPATNTASPRDLVSGIGGGFVETIVTFPAP
jgi:uncharacterized protein (TIGR02598 family)